MRESVAVASEPPEKTTKNAEPTNPKAHRFSSRNLLRRLLRTQAAGTKKSAKSEKIS